MTIRRLLTALALAAVTLPLSANPARSAPPAPLAPGGARASGPLEPDTVIGYGEYVDGGARVEVIDLETGRRQVISDTHGEAGDHGEAADPGAGGDVGTQSFAPADRCSDANASEFTFLNGSNSYWHTVEAWKYNPTNADSSAPSWRNEIVAASDVWQDTTNPCGLPDTIGWITPSTWTDDSAANVPRNDCSDNPSDGKNTFGWKPFTNDNFVAWACVFRSGTWNIEGDVGFNSNQDFCHNPCSGYDVRATSLHEWGHILGLGHSCTGYDWWEGGGGADPCDPVEEATVMRVDIHNPNTTLSRGDVNGADDLYPTEVGYTVDGTTLENPAGSSQKLSPGHEYTLHVDLKNTGMRAWTTGAADPFVLSTKTEAASIFEGSDWVTPSRPSRVDSDRTNGPDNNNTTIVRDEVGRFTFKVMIPFGVEGNPAAALETLGLLNGSSLVTGGDVNRTFDVGTYGSTFQDQPPASVVVQEVEAAETWVDMKNTGTAPWFIGPNEVVTLAASNGAGGSRCSPFAGSDWLSCEVASRLDENVTATVLPTSPSTVPVNPGQVGRFRFKFRSPLNPSLVGLHDEAFDTELTGQRWMGSPTTATVVVL